ncbi:alpha/beta hydrolase [Kitasatospora sp. NPDC049285]|uniref:alpha/beta hydrolase n=1 Tax=Kitasatospora sp. NPDC049285 TaxID=3157096 RepID=UPI00341E0652
MMDEVEVFHEVDGERLACLVLEPVGAVRPGTALVMHGAGADRSQGLPLARELAGVGYGAVAFDFSGHGGSSGGAERFSLARGLRQALGVLERFAPDGPVLPVGFSMSAQTVADLLPVLGGRVRAVGLGAPAVFPREAWGLPFGDPGFGRALRDAEGWRDSTLFGSLADYAGSAVLFVPGRDEVVPPGMTEAVDAALRTRATVTRLTLPGADHVLGPWLAEHPRERAALADALLCATD